MDTDEDCCVICLAGFTNPVCTPCPAQHMFCMQCLNGWISEAAEAGRTAYSCPSCRRAFDVAKGLADATSESQAALREEQFESRERVGCHHIHHQSNRDDHARRRIFGLDTYGG
ncbi:hypothetical protein F5146DRAFT_671813 [Armillaria mellea]|nr:hypothetical protein F5146DRAFT_622563 [Armillaria mellea]KAK0188572.1 hypothetical protein F5146DRAFT_671813 [Armillaria mellea]